MREKSHFSASVFYCQCKQKSIKWESPRKEAWKACYILGAAKGAVTIARSTPLTNGFIISHVAMIQLQVLFSFCCQWFGINNIILITINDNIMTSLDQ